MKLLSKNKNKAKFEVMVSTKQPFRIYHFSRCSNLNYFQGALQEMKIFYMNQKICIFLSFTVAECCRSGFSTILVPALRSDIRGYCKYILYINCLWASSYWEIWHYQGKKLALSKWPQRCFSSLVLKEIQGNFCIKFETAKIGQIKLSGMLSQGFNWNHCSKNSVHDHLRWTQLFFWIWL